MREGHGKTAAGKPVNSKQADKRTATCPSINADSPVNGIPTLETPSPSVAKAEPVDVGPVDAESMEAGLVDVGHVDAESVEAKPAEVGPVDAEIRARMLAVVDGFLESIRSDPNILAVVVGGSLAYDDVWEKSDIDMTVVVRDQVLRGSGYTLTEDGFALNVALATRSEFRRGLDRSVGGSWQQAYLAKGNMVYTLDESLREAFEAAKVIGEDDRALSMLMLACMILGNLEKARKWLVTRHDTAYAQYFYSMCAEPVANMELILRGEPASRASIRKAMLLNPTLMHAVYLEPMSRLFDEPSLHAALDALDAYLDQHVERIARPVIAYMGDGAIKTGTLIRKHFGMDPHFLVHGFDWLAEKGILEKASQTIRITPKGRQVFEEIGYLYLGGS